MGPIAKFVWRKKHLQILRVTKCQYLKFTAKTGNEYEKVQNLVY